ncbi:MAG: winged helix-turn-helix transcriptional regulator [Halonotius sp.]
MGYRIDEIDQLILFYLGSDARNTSAAEIAEEVDVTPATVRNRIQQLEDGGIIQGYHADIDYEATGETFTTQFTCTAPVSERSKIAREALDTSGVVSVRELLAGQENLVVTAVGTDTDDINRIAHELSTLGATIEREDIVQNESVRPYRSFGPDDDLEQPTGTEFQAVGGGAEVVEFTASAESAITGQTLNEADQADLLPEDVLIVSIERDDRQLTPDGETRIEAGDVVSVFSSETVPPRLVDAFDGDADAVEEV